MKDLSHDKKNGLAPEEFCGWGTSGAGPNFGAIKMGKSHAAAAASIIASLLIVGCNSLSVSVESDPGAGILRKDIRAVSFHLNPLRDAELADFHYSTPADGGREIKLGALRQKGAGELLQNIGAAAIRSKLGQPPAGNIESIEARLAALEAGGK